MKGHFSLVAFGEHPVFAAADAKLDAVAAFHLKGDEVAGGGGCMESVRAACIAADGGAVMRRFAALIRDDAHDRQTGRVVVFVPL